ncbi:MAG: amidohydrolase family protein [Planctomycetes bacterium]|nr:amidohydrolase family protein [Planctomycetota bacterium]
MNSHTENYALRARYVFPVERPPLADGVVVVRHGHIHDVTTTPPRGCRLYDLGNVALLPGLVNAHVHLNFSLHTTPIGQPGIAFAEWLDLVIRQRRIAVVADEDAVQRKAVLAGLRESRRHGTTTLANIARDELHAPKAVRGTEGWAFLELIGLTVERAELQRIKLDEWLEIATQRAFKKNGPWRPGISPHAPYTARNELVMAACTASRRHRLPVAMHLAESWEELELLDRQSGPLVETLKRWNSWDASDFEPGMKPRDYLEMLADADRALVIHGNYLDASDRSWLAAHSDRMAVVYCPRTHHYFGHPHYPLAELLTAGVSVALGTDGRGTNPDLSLLSEMRHVARVHSSVPPSEIVRLGTLGGAAALGCADRIGSLMPGKHANVVAIGLPDRDDADPHALLFQCETDVKLTIYRGKAVYPRKDRGLAPCD